jgi:hypothetical protein
VTTPFTRGGAKAIRKKGHRGYVGGSWEEFGRLQFDFMVGQGLQPANVLVDVACGSLRAGVHFIPYLDAGNYLGIEKEALLVARGLDLELPAEVREKRRPEIIVSSAFEFDRFSKAPEFGIANSLFTHLTPDVIGLCLTNLRAATKSCRFFVSFKEVDKPIRNPWRSADYRGFSYTRDQMAEFGHQSGWDVNYVGAWGHRRGLQMMEYVAGNE